MALSVGLALVALGSASSAAALTYKPELPKVTYETEPTTPPFCASVTVRDFLEPLERLPKLNAPPPSGQVGFGPASLRLHPLPALITGSGPAGYRLYLEGRAASIHPNWVVTTTLARVTWKGRVVKVMDRAQRHVRTVRAGRGAGVQFEVKGVSAPYRITTVFRSKSGKRLGKFGFYFRVVIPTEDARLGLNASSFLPGQTVFGRVENFGSRIAVYGGAYSIERLEGAAWELAPESPSGPWTAIALFSPPGQSGSCSKFRVPSSTPPGRYRMVKGVGFPSPNSPSIDGTNRVLSAEFDVLP